MSRGLKALDYLFEMHLKYAPTKMVGTDECETDESKKWLDNIIVVKKELEAFDAVKPLIGKVEIFGGDYFLVFSDGHFYRIPKEKYDLLKEIL